MATVPTYVIDLGRDETKRWHEVIPREKAIAGPLLQEIAIEFERVPEILRWIFARLYQAFGGLYRARLAPGPMRWGCRSARLRCSTAPMN